MCICFPFLPGTFLRPPPSSRSGRGSPPSPSPEPVCVFSFFFFSCILCFSFFLLFFVFKFIPCALRASVTVSPCCLLCTMQAPGRRSGHCRLFPPSLLRLLPLLPPLLPLLPLAPAPAKPRPSSDLWAHRSLCGISLQSLLMSESCGDEHAFPFVPSLMIDLCHMSSAVMRPVMRTRTFCNF